jgi:ribosomal protein S18 acetylase RimI-like enzyme
VLLLAEVITFTATHEYRQIRLDVIDTNPRARALYERVGFVAARHVMSERTAEEGRVIDSFVPG